MIFGERLRDYASDEAELRLLICGAQWLTIQSGRQEPKHASDRSPKPNNQLAVTKKHQTQETETYDAEELSLNIPQTVLYQAHNEMY